MIRTRREDEVAYHADVSFFKVGDELHSVVDEMARAANLGKSRAPNHLKLFSGVLDVLGRIRCDAQDARLPKSVTSRGRVY